MIAAKHLDSVYLEYDVCAGEEGEVACRTVRLSKARKEYPCFWGLAPFGDKHMIKAGDRYRYEKALIDRSFWGCYRVCLPCIDRALSEEDECDREVAAIDC